MWEDVNEGEKGSKVMGMALPKEKYSGQDILQIERNGRKTNGTIRMMVRRIYKYEVNYCTYSPGTGICIA